MAYGWYVLLRDTFLSRPKQFTATECETFKKKKYEVLSPVIEEETQGGAGMSGGRERESAVLARTLPQPFQSSHLIKSSRHQSPGRIKCNERNIIANHIPDIECLPRHNYLTKSHRNATTIQSPRHFGPIKMHSNHITDSNQTRLSPSPTQTTLYLHPTRHSLRWEHIHSAHHFTHAHLPVHQGRAE